jgi:hypothetical protein
MVYLEKARRGDDPKEFRGAIITAAARNSHRDFRPSSPSPPLRMRHT